MHNFADLEVENQEDCHNIFAKRLQFTDSRNIFNKILSNWCFNAVLSFTLDHDDWEDVG